MTKWQSQDLKPAPCRLLSRLGHMVLDAVVRYIHQRAGVRPWDQDLSVLSLPDVSRAPLGGSSYPVSALPVTSVPHVHAWWVGCVSSPCC